MERAQVPPPSDSRPASLEFNEAVDANIVRLVDAYRDILRGSQINATNPMTKQLQDSVSAASIATHCQNILDQIHYLQTEVILKCKDGDSSSSNSSSNNNSTNMDTEKT